MCLINMMESSQPPTYCLDPGRFMLFICFLGKIYGVRSSKFNWALCAQLQAKFIDPVFAKTSPKRSFTVTENKRCGLDFAKTGSKIRAYSAPPPPHILSLSF